MGLDVRFCLFSKWISAESTTFLASDRAVVSHLLHFWVWYFELVHMEKGGYNIEALELSLYYGLALFIVYFKNVLWVGLANLLVKKRVVVDDGSELRLH